MEPPHRRNGPSHVSGTSRGDVEAHAGRRQEPPLPEIPWSLGQDRCHGKRVNLTREDALGETELPAGLGQEDEGHQHRPDRKPPPPLARHSHQVKMGNEGSQEQPH